MATKAINPPDTTDGSSDSTPDVVTVVAGSGAGGSFAATPGGNGDRTGSTFKIEYGRRPMKGYPITEGELGQLFGIGLLATICFTLAGALFGFAVDVTKDLALAPETPTTVVGFWEAAKTFSWIISGILLVAGVFFVVRGNSVLSGIKRSTLFPNDDVSR